MELSFRARELLADLGQRFGVDRLAPDADGMIAFGVDDRELALGYSPPNDSFYLFSVLAPSVDTAMAELMREALRLSAAFAPRRTRVALTDTAMTLVAEVFLADLGGDAFLDRVDAFVADCNTATATLFPPQAQDDAIDPSFAPDSGMIFRA